MPCSSLLIVLGSINSFSSNQQNAVWPRTHKLLHTTTWIVLLSQMSLDQYCEDGYVYVLISLQETLLHLSLLKNSTFKKKCLLLNLDYIESLLCLKSLISKPHVLPELQAFLPFPEDQEPLPHPLHLVLLFLLSHQADHQDPGKRKKIIK